MGFYNVINASSMQTGQPEDVSQVLANFNAIAAVLNGALDNSNIDAAAAIALSKLSQGAAGKVLGMNQSPVAAWVNGLQQINDSLLGADAANIDFQSIPATFAHLIVVGYLRGTAAVTGTEFRCQYNADSGSNYDYQTILGNSTSVTAVGAVSGAQTFARLGRMPGSTAPGNSFSTVVVFIGNYAGAIGHKTGIGFSQSREAAGALTDNIVEIGGSSWFNATPAAINRITFFPNGGNLKAGSRITLYGVG